AAIDFLLLAHGRGCEGFESICCMNLLNHLESIYPSIQQLKGGVFKLQEDNGGFFEKWLRDL
ncbi:hypothetical protein N325_05963, partial [Colius striatus]